MPLLDSFLVDHTRMHAPAVRIAKKMTTPKGDTITVYDLRFTKPNESLLSEKGIHTLEHLFAGFIRSHLNSDNIEIIDVSPMGCRTGFYMSVIGNADENQVGLAWEKSMKDVLAVKNISDIPELNEYQCGTCKMHSLTEAQQIANEILNSSIKINKNSDLLLDQKKLEEISDKYSHNS